MAAPQHVIYAGMKFPEYQFREYPKWVKNSEGTDVLVQTAEEEAEITGEAEEAEPAKTTTPAASTGGRRRRNGE